jgi:hypothetical protein
LLFITEGSFQEKKIEKNVKQWSFKIVILNSGLSEQLEFEKKENWA